MPPGDEVMRTIAEHLADELGRALSGVDSAARAVAIGEVVEVAGASAKFGRRVEICVRDDCFDIAFHVPEKRGSPFEQVIKGPSERSDELIAAVVGFVTDLVTERLIVSMNRGFFGGGRRFMTPESLALHTRRTRWVASWAGTYDRE